MNGARLSTTPARLRLPVLLSVLALLAFAGFPVAAQADSSGAQYEEGLPHACGSSCTPSGHHEPPAKQSQAGGGGSTYTPPSGETGGEAPESGSGGGTTTGGGNGGGGNGGGQPAPHKTGGGGKEAAKNRAPNPGQQKATPVATHNDSGGSSPLVPILIAIAVLAAISIAAVAIRQRRQRDTPPTAAKAG